MGETTRQLQEFGETLVSASSLVELVPLARAEVARRTRYRQLWFMVVDRERPDEFRLIEFAGERRPVVWDSVPAVPIEGKPLLKQLMEEPGPLVMDDAWVDPRADVDLAQRLGIRTLVCVRFPLPNHPVAALAVGTFGDEGSLPPTAEEIDYLIGMSWQVSIAASRIRYYEVVDGAQKERERTERGLVRIQRLESLGILAGGIAHDFNNLLTVILSSTALLRSKPTVDPEGVDAIDHAARRGSQLVRSLLAMGRRQELSMVEFDLNERLEELVSLVKRVIPESIRIELIRGSRLPLVEADPVQLDQVFMNLCVNARDAMPHGGRITIETEQVLVNHDYVQTHPWARTGRYVLVTVTDTGQGMSQAVQDRIFEPFFSTKAEQANAGLGLATTYGIVRQHDGLLHCYSELGVGTTFKVYLRAQERRATTVGTKLEGAPPRSVRHEEVLVVEDDLNVLAAMVRILKDAGYTVTAAPNGERACELAATHLFDIAIVDVVMPGMDCRELAKQLRSLQPSLKILLSSGYGPGSGINDIVEETGFELLTKPYGPERLLEAIHRTLNASG